MCQFAVHGGIATLEHEPHPRLMGFPRRGWVSTPFKAKKSLTFANRFRQWRFSKEQYFECENFAVRTGENASF